MDDATQHVRPVILLKERDMRLAAGSGGQDAGRPISIIQEGAMLVEKPWGHYEDLFRTPSCVFKRITVNPHQRLSLQRHRGRVEYWYCLEGHGMLEITDNDGTVVSGRELYPNQIRLDLPAAYVIHPLTWHRLVNTGDEPLVVAEMQVGDCREDDVERMEDDYGRVEED